MSLINEMLNTLEKNKKDDDARNKALSGISPVMRKQQGAVMWKIVFWTIIVAVIASITWHYHAQINAQLTKTISTFKNKIFITKTKAAILPTTSIPTIKLQNIFAEQKNDQTILDFILTAPASYYLEHTSEQQLHITLSDTTLSGNLPVKLENTFLITLNTKQNKNNTVITLDLLPGTKTDTLQMIDKPQPHLHLAFSNPQLTSSSKMSKSPTPKLPEEQASDRYQEILEFLTQNKISEAITNLHLFLGDFPNHMQAREMLVSLLIREGNIKKANEIITVGLNKAYDYHPFIKLKAHILVKQNEPNDAIDLLRKYLATTNDIEYLALLAALYQQRGLFIEAAGLYDQLTKLQPQKTVWWLGLGVALESANKMNGAKEAYEQAHRYSDVPPDLMIFLENKLKK